MATGQKKYHQYCFFRGLWRLRRPLWPSAPRLRGKLLLLVEEERVALLPKLRTAGGAAKRRWQQATLAWTWTAFDFRLWGRKFVDPHQISAEHRIKKIKWRRLTTRWLFPPGEFVKVRRGTNWVIMGWLSLCLPSPRQEKGCVASPLSAWWKQKPMSSCWWWNSGSSAVAAAAFVFILLFFHLLIAMTTRRESKVVTRTE